MRSVITLILILLSPLCFAGEINLLFTASLNAEIYGCECPEDKKAGLSRVGYLIHESESRYPNQLRVDTGGNLTLIPNAPMTSVILDIYRDLNYDLIAPGTEELVNGVQNLMSKQKLLFSSANIRIKKGPLFKEYKIIIRNGIRTGLFTLTHPDALIFEPDLQKNIILTDPVETAGVILKQLKDESCDLIILVSHLGEKYEKQIADRYPGIDVIVSGRDQLYYPELKKTGSTLIVACGSNGNRAGILKLKNDESGWNGALVFLEADHLKTPELDWIRDRLKQFKQDSQNKRKDLIF